MIESQGHLNNIQNFTPMSKYMCKQGRTIPVDAWMGPESSRSFRAPRSPDNWHMKVARLSILRTGRL